MPKYSTDLSHDMDRLRYSGKKHFILQSDEITSVTG
jgi:hypothetical protein